MLFASWLLFSPALASDTTNTSFRLTGKTRYQEKALQSGEITFLRAEPGGAVYKTGIRSDGGFGIHLPAGPYFIMGSGTDPVSKKSLFGFWTNNPLRLYEDMTEPVVLPFVRSTGPPVTAKGEGIRGRVLFEGKPVKGAVVAVFLDASGQFHGLPFNQSSPTSETGEFNLQLESGKYFIMARVRRRGGIYQGPLLKGDFSGFYPHNPVILRQGEGLILDIPVIEVNRPRGEGSLAPGEAILVKGRVEDVTGEPLAGVWVVLYSRPEMVGRPAFISSPTDKDGTFRLEVSRGGKYFAAARSVIGRPPKTGDMEGFYSGTEDHSVELTIGDKLEGVDIVVRERW